MTASNFQLPTPKTRSQGVGSRIVGFVLVLSVACAGPSPIANARRTARDLAQGVLEGFERRDVVTLRALALTEQEFREHIWPALPASRPERNLPFSYVWGDLRQKSEQSLTELLARYGGQRFELLGVEYRGETTRYACSVVHRDTVLVVRDRDGAEQQLRLYGSTLETDGTFKVFSYIVDD
jgi:hypothetical protein